MENPYVWGTTAVKKIVVAAVVCGVVALMIASNRETLRTRGVPQDENSLQQNRLPSLPVQSDALAEGVRTAARDVYGKVLPFMVVRATRGFAFKEGFVLAVVSISVDGGEQRTGWRLLFMWQSIASLEAQLSPR